MSAIMNGIALHGGFITYGATFLMFMEYARNAVHMAALMKQHCIFVYTHDSIVSGRRRTNSSVHLKRNSSSSYLNALCRSIYAANR